MNHTPGWKIQQLEEAHNGHTDWPTFAIRDNTTNVCLALVGTVDHYDSDHNLDRARLIAAAPELAAAMRIAAGAIDDLIVQAGYSKDVGPA